jgi:Predicted ring-cleavage extradiol dioxygenase
MHIQPAFTLADTTHIGTVALNVADLANMSQFYQGIIGLQLLEQTDQQAILGVGQRPLLVLKQLADPLPKKQLTGLYHTAFLVPTRAALGDAILHYLTIKAPLIGASDHGYSEALYLGDPEGNGIEVYRDKPVAQWDIRADGEIVGTSLELDAQGVIDEATRQWSGFPEGTTVGHIHLQVADLKQTQDFYTNVLGLSLKNNFGSQAKFFATGAYHHHVGTNTWNGRDLPPMTANDLGLAYYSFVTKDYVELKRIESHFVADGIDFTKEADGSLWVTDPSGIHVKFETELS